MDIVEAFKLPVGELLSVALFSSRQRHSELPEQWVRQSYALGGALPTSLLGVSIQRAGDFDVMLRCMEDEQSSRPADGSDPLFVFNTHCTIADLWIGMVYEVVRLLLDRNLIASEQALALGHDLRLVRVPLEKHEVPQDRKLTHPLDFVREPRQGDTTDHHSYDRTDPTRAHIMPRSVSARGSMMWHVLDVVAARSFWIERRELSDRFLALS